MSNKTKYYCDFCKKEIENRKGIKIAILYTDCLGDYKYDYKEWERLRIKNASSEVMDICNNCMGDETEIRGGEYHPSLGLKNKGVGIFKKIFNLTNK